MITKWGTIIPNLLIDKSQSYKIHIQSYFLCTTLLQYLIIITHMSLQDKQQLLRTQIVDQGEDPEKFYEFWQQYNLDLNQADLDTITRIIQQFKSHLQKNQQNQPEEQQNQEFGDYVQATEAPSNFYENLDWDFLVEKPKKQETPKKHLHQIQSPKTNNKSQSPIKKSEDKSLNQRPVEHSNKNIAKDIELLEVQESKPNLKQTKEINNITFQDVIKTSNTEKRKCLKLQSNILSHHINVEINIIKYAYCNSRMQEVQYENSGIINKLWKGTDFLFTLKTIGRNKQKAIGISWQVKRTHGDFQWLRSMLVKMYPGHVVPPLPNQTKNCQELNGYQRKLESFLLDCFHCPELRNSKYFEVFLSYAKQFENFKKSNENMSKPKDIQHILNMNGQIQLLYGQKIDEYSIGLQNFLSKSSIHLKKYFSIISSVKLIIEQINSLYDEISVKYKQLSDVFIVMSSESCNFSEQECYPCLTQTYSQISNLLNQHSSFCLQQKDFIQTFMHSHFAYEKDRIDNMQGLIAKRKNYILEFSKPKHHSQKTQGGGSMFSKLSSFFGDKVESVDVPSTNTQILKEQVGFFNSQLMKESIRCVDGMINSHVNHFSMYGHSRIDNVDNMQKIWSTVLVELSQLKMK